MGMWDEGGWLSPGSEDTGLPGLGFVCSQLKQCRGIRTAVVPKKLLVPPGLSRQAGRSDVQWDPDT